MTDFFSETGFDMAVVRRHLNELQFEHGTRRLRIGLVSDLLATQSSGEIEPVLQRLREQLAIHELGLERAPDNADELWIVQSLRHRPTDVNAMARAMQWVSRITTVAFEMVVPAVLGTWLDSRWGTSYFALVGVMIGVPLGLWHLLIMTKVSRS